MRQRAAAEQQPGVGEAVERGPQLWCRPPRHVLNQIIAELAADNRTDLRNLLGRRPEPIEARDQRGMQSRWDREVRQPTRR